MRWETKQSFDGQLYQEYLFQNLLKLDHFSSSYDKKLVFFMPHSPCMHICIMIIMCVFSISSNALHNSFVAVLLSH